MEAGDEVLGHLIGGARPGALREARSGVALAIAACSSQLRGDQAPVLLEFLLSTGLADADEAVRAQMVDAGTYTLQLAPEPLPSLDQQAGINPLYLSTESSM